MGLFNLLEKIIFRDSENERYDPKDEEKDKTNEHIRRISKTLKERERMGVVTPFNTYIYGKCDIDKVCKAFERKGYTALANALNRPIQLVLIKKEQ